MLHDGCPKEAMSRLASLLAVGVLTIVAGASGVAAGGRSDPATRAERAASDARRLGPGARVKVALNDGTTIKGVLVAVAERDVSVLVTAGPQTTERHVAYDDIERIKRESSHTGRWIALGIVIGLLVPIGVCAASA